jgi:hypothetical protein
MQEILKGKNTIQALWDILSDFKFLNFPLLLSFVETEAVQVESDQIKLMQLMAKSGYQEFLKSNIKLPQSHQQNIIQKLMMLDLLDVAGTCQGKIDFATIGEIIGSQSLEILIEFLILVLTSGILKGKINTQKKILLVSDTMPRNYGNIQDLAVKIESFSEKVNDSIQMLSSQIEIIDAKQKEWKKEEEEYQAQVKKISDKVKRSHRSVK